ncbi:MAG: lactonase family protein [Terrimicrobiaceae bacterium]
MIPFYIGTYSGVGKQTGILLSTLDTKSGAITEPQTVSGLENPSFLATSPDGKFLYAAIEHEGGAVAAFRIQGDHSLAPLNTKPSGGKGACHVWADGTHVVVSNYSSGNVNGFPVLPDGSLGDATADVAFSGSGPHPKRQQKPFAHAAIRTPDGRFVYVCDLGTDHVWIFRLDPDSGKLIPADPDSGSVPPGAGPRHLALHPKSDFLYVNNEMGLSVSAFGRDHETGALRLIQTIPTLPDEAVRDGATTSALAIHPNGRWLYVSNRGHNSISIFEIQPDGTLTMTQNTASIADTPREFAIDPSGTWLLVAGQKDGLVVSMKINSEDGTLTPASRLQTNSIPVSLAFLP